MTTISCCDCRVVLASGMFAEIPSPKNVLGDFELCDECYEARMQAEADKADAELAGGVE